jgi:hypothetical protein
MQLFGGMSNLGFDNLLARRISQVCWQIVPESNGTWEKLSLPGGIVKFLEFRKLQL